MKVKTSIHAGHYCNGCGIPGMDCEMVFGPGTVCTKEGPIVRFAFRTATG